VELAECRRLVQALDRAGYTQQRDAST
jgi:hypothetical protein